MKIPWDAPMFYLSESDISAVEGARTEPVLSSSKLGSNLSGQTTAYSRNPAHGDTVSTTAPWSVANEERRKQQRRQHTQWVPLDTRLSERRQSPQIRCEI